MSIKLSRIMVLVIAGISLNIRADEQDDILALDLDDNAGEISFDMDEVDVRVSKESNMAPSEMQLEVNPEEEIIITSPKEEELDIIVNDTLTGKAEELEITLDDKPDLEMDID